MQHISKKQWSKDAQEHAGQGRKAWLRGTKTREKLYYFSLSMRKKILWWQFSNKREKGDILKEAKSSPPRCW